MNVVTFPDSIILITPSCSSTKILLSPACVMVVGLEKPVSKLTKLKSGV